MSDINPYAIIKDVNDWVEKIVSFEFQKKTFSALVLLYIYKRVYYKDFLTLKNIIVRFIPFEIKNVILLVIVPILNLLFMVGTIGILFVFIIGIVSELNDKKGWFDSLYSNYLYYFRKNQEGICDYIGEKLIVLPVNFGIIIVAIFYIFDSQTIIKYIEMFTLIKLTPYIVLYVYLFQIVSLVFKKVDNDY